MIFKLVLNILHLSFTQPDHLVLCQNFGTTGEKHYKLCLFNSDLSAKGRLYRALFVWCCFLYKLLVGRIQCQDPGWIFSFHDG